MDYGGSKDKVDRDSLMLKERKVNGEEIYIIEEVKEERDGTAGKLEARWRDWKG